jgi:phosphoadenosine phosphosulfate reductase
MQNELKLKELEKQLRDKSAEESLKIVAVNFSGKIIYTTSFGIEDQVITHMIFSNAIDIDVATLDTGRLFPETYKVFNETIKKYNKKIKVYFPDNARVEKMVTEKGPFSFYYSQGNRHESGQISLITESR